MTTRIDRVERCLDVVLYQPEIPPNTGNVMRLCANAPARLHLVEPLGFVMDDRRLRRAGLDYRDQVQLQRHPDLAALEATCPRSRWLMFTTRASRSYSDWDYRPGDVLMFGPETRGLPETLIESVPEAQRLVIPQLPESRSLNLANAVAIALYEAWRQMGFTGSTRSRA